MTLDLKILLADDHTVVRQGVYLILKEDYKNLAITHASDFLRVIDFLQEQDFDLVVLDISIPEGKGIQMIAAIKAIRPEVKILIFSAFEEDLYAIRYLKAGVDGYLNKLCSEAEFKTAIATILDNGVYISAPVQQKMAHNASRNIADNPLELLSVREIEIARLLILGDGNLEIANKLALQNSTVSTYKNRIFEKLDISNTISLVSLFKSYE
ncbi:MAG: response regulator transcription factor [Flavobacterium sp.]|nr:response regulator transcription factor [Flavobacterium sp.]